MKLTKGHLEAMKQVKDGADVSDIFVARLLREVEKEAPNLISITKPMMGPYSGAGHVPYFGAILTEAGKKRIKGKT